MLLIPFTLILKITQKPIKEMQSNYMKKPSKIIYKKEITKKSHYFRFLIKNLNELLNFKLKILLLNYI